MLLMKRVLFALAGVVASLSAYTPPAVARCAPGFTTTPEYNACVPENPAARKIWLECGEEQVRLGLPEVASCISEARRIKLIDNYVYYCRKAKLPMLMQ